MEVFKLFFVLLCFVVCQMTRGRRTALALTQTLNLNPTLTPTPTPTLPKAIGLRHGRGFAARFGETDVECADHLKHRSKFGTLSGMIFGVRTSQRKATFSFFFSHTYFSSSWASRGHRCHPFPPPVLAYNFYRA